VISLAVAGASSILIAFFLTPLIISWSKKKQFGQPIREEGPSSHTAKAGTPNLGGIAIVVASVGGYIISHLTVKSIHTRAAPLVLLILAGAGAVGFLDDYLKIRRKKNEGLNKRLKLGLQIIIAIIFAVLALKWSYTSTNLSFTSYNFPNFKLNDILWGIWAVIVVVGSSNAVNLSDGLDGLAAGSSSFIFAGFAIMAYFEFRHPQVYHLVPALDLATVAASITAACLGFLWFNAAPAKIIMGDTGALALGGGLAALGLETNLILLLPILAGLFVIITMSVIIQVFVFKLFHKRVFKMAPLHHHFELKGWPEFTVIVRFWILSSIFTVIGLGAFLGYYISIGTPK
jgi:phospho-N-acetylmuramoyl-pentapeptide-transferase